jgi:hypothetical protein
MDQNMKRLPYGINDFEAVIEQNQYYVDKTMYLPLLKNQPSNIFFIRPRRFGKSIFLSMLHAYYDCSKKEKFQTLFGDLWVGLEKMECISQQKENQWLKWQMMQYFNFPY